MCLCSGERLITTAARAEEISNKDDHELQVLLTYFKCIK